MVEYPLEATKSRTGLGGGDSYRLTREIYLKAKPRLVVGDRPVPQELMDEAMAEIKLPTMKRSASGSPG